MIKLDVLIAVEDPGAANFIADIPDQLKKNGLRCAIISYGFAQNFLSQMKIKTYKVDFKEDVKIILKRFFFKILIAGTSQNPESKILQLIDICKRKSITTIGVIDMYADFNLRFKGHSLNPLNYAPEYLIVPDKLTFNAFVSLGYVRKNIFTIIHPNLIKIRERSLTFPKEIIKIKRKNFLKNYVEGTEIWMFAGEVLSKDKRLQKDKSYKIFGRGNSNHRIHIVLEELLEVRKRKKPRPFIILRPHPKNENEDFEEYFNEIDFISKNPDPLEDILCSDLVVGSSTIFLMEAHYSGKPTLSIMTKPGEEIWCPSVLNGLTPSALSAKEIEKELDFYKNRKLKINQIQNKVTIMSIIKKIKSYKNM